MPLFLWFAAQIGAIALAAARVPLWSQSPPAGEQLALAYVLAVQIAVSALLFPQLLHTLRTTIVVIATAWPLALLATFLADALIANFIVAQTYVTLWLIALHLWARLLNNPAHQPYASAIASMLAFGGALLFYLHLDYGNSSPTRFWPGELLAGPIIGAISQTIPPKTSPISWAFPLLFLSLALAATFVKRSARSTKIG